MLLAVRRRPVPYWKFIYGDFYIWSDGMGKFIDLTGRKFGRLTVLRRGRNCGASAGWICECDCGTIRNVSGSHLRNGHTKSCGCYKHDLHTSHNMSNTRLYHIWENMNKRCHDKNNKECKYHGSRGIKIHFTCFEDFAHWAFISGYSDNFSIDRIDNNGNYSRDNCRWVTNYQQSRNMRSNIFITHPETGERLCAVDWSRKLGGADNVVRTRIKSYGWSPQKAITTPVHKKRLAIS